MRIGIISIGMIVLLIASTIPAMAAGSDDEPWVSFDTENLKVVYHDFLNGQIYLVEVIKLPGFTKSIDGEIVNNYGNVTSVDISPYLNGRGSYQIKAYVNNVEYLDKTIVIP